MALLLILFALFGFLFAGTGTVTSSGSDHATATKPAPVMSGSAVVKPVRTVRLRQTAGKCSQHVAPSNGAVTSRCRTPAKP